MLKSAYTSTSLCNVKDLVQQQPFNMLYAMKRLTLPTYFITVVLVLDLILHTHQGVTNGNLIGLTPPTRNLPIQSRSKPTASAAFLQADTLYSTSYWTVLYDLDLSEYMRNIKALNGTFSQFRHWEHNLTKFNVFNYDNENQSHSAAIQITRAQTIHNRLINRFDDAMNRLQNVARLTSTPKRTRPKRFLDILNLGFELYNYQQIQSIHSDLRDVKSRQREIIQQMLLSTRILNSTHFMAVANTQHIHDLADHVQRLTNNYNQVVQTVNFVSNFTTFLSAMEEYEMILELFSIITSDMIFDVMQIEDIVDSALNHRISQYLIPPSKANHLNYQIQRRLPATKQNPFASELLSQFYNYVNIKMIPSPGLNKLKFILEIPIYSMDEFMVIYKAVPLPTAHPTLNILSTVSLEHSYIGVQPKTYFYATFDNLPKQSVLKAMPPFTIMTDHRVKPSCLSSLFWQDNKSKCTSKVMTNNRHILHLFDGLFYYTGTDPMTMTATCYNNNSFENRVSKPFTVMPNSNFSIPASCELHGSNYKIISKPIAIFRSVLEQSNYFYVIENPHMDLWTDINETKFPILKQMDANKLTQIINDMDANPQNDFSIPMNTLYNRLMTLQNQANLSSKHSFLWYCVLILAVVITIIIIATSAYFLFINRTQIFMLCRSMIFNKTFGITKAPQPEPIYSKVDIDMPSDLEQKETSTNENVLSETAQTSEQKSANKKSAK